MSFKRPPQKATTAIATAIWLLGVSLAIAALGAYSSLPGRSGEPAESWPAESGLERAGDRPTLVLIAHPRCPCTRATLGELARLLAQTRHRIQVHVLFTQPGGMSDEWAETDLWSTASQLTDVTVHRDLDGVEARRFHAETSGQVLFYGSDGRLKFHGGITIARGHAGDNPGRSAILALLDDEASAPLTAAVFGCALFAPPTPQECSQCQR